MVSIPNALGYSRSEIYDPLSGKWIRTTLPRDVFHISSPGGTTPATAGDFVIASGTTSATKEVFIYGIGYGSSNATDFCVTVGTSTIAATRLAANDRIEITGAPIYRIPPSTTVQIIAKNATTTGTYSGYLFGERRPIPSKLEAHA
jgi:hypothetical protein